MSYQLQQTVFDCLCINTDSLATRGSDKSQASSEIQQYGSTTRVGITVFAFIEQLLRTGESHCNKNNLD
ncbi:hypothetical protein V5G28_007095 [Scytonema sp. PRP1]